MLFIYKGVGWRGSGVSGAEKRSGKKKNKRRRRRTFFFGGELGGGEVVCDGTRMELSPDVEDVLIGEACRGEAIKAAQGLNLCLLVQPRRVRPTLSTEK